LPRRRHITRDRRQPPAEQGPPLETTAAPDALWRHWSDMATWPQWNEGIDTIDVEGPFAVGTTFTMTPPGQEPIRARLGLEAARAS
jgi:hypothetical protein